VTGMIGMIGSHVESYVRRSGAKVTSSTSTALIIARAEM
jgi:hypothetical protein